MTAADTSAWIDFSRGGVTAAASRLERVLDEGTLVIPEPVLFEVLSGPGITSEAEQALTTIPRIEALSGMWERAGKMRRRLLKKKSRARAMDCLIAQVCIDHGVPLIASDSDFKKFKKFGLVLVG